MKNKFMCALGGCKKQCYVCKDDEDCDKQWIKYKKRLGLTNRIVNKIKTMAAKLKLI